MLCGLGTLVYVAAMAALTVAVERVVFQGWISHLVPTVVAASLAWLFAGVLVVLCVIGNVGELRDANGDEGGQP